LKIIPEGGANELKQVTEELKKELQARTKQAATRAAADLERRLQTPS
jgi:hypothetical protein